MRDPSYFSCHPRWDIWFPPLIPGGVLLSLPGFPGGMGESSILGGIPGGIALGFCAVRMGGIPGNIGRVTMKQQVVTRKQRVRENMLC